MLLFQILYLFGFQAPENDCKFDKFAEVASLKAPSCLIESSKSLIFNQKMEVWLKYYQSPLSHFTQESKRLKSSIKLFYF